MTVDHQPAADPGQRALARHVATMRRQRRWYLAAIAATTVAIVVLVVAIWSTSEIRHVELHTASATPTAVPVSAVSAQPQPAWTTGDTPATGSAVAGGVVVTYSTHTVSGRSAQTGAVLWSYSRTDRRVCEVAQIGNRTIALYFNGANCDEVTALDSATGRRAWVRTLDENAQPIDGRPTIVTREDSLYVGTAEFLYSIDPISSYDRWILDAPSSCGFTGFAPGSGGVLVAQHCPEGDSLLLRDAFKGDDDKDNLTDDQKHQIIWRLTGTTAVPLAADAFIGALDPSSGELVSYSPAKGKVLARVALPSVPREPRVVERVAADDGELIWLDGHLYALSASGSRLLWSARTAALPDLSFATGASIGRPTLAAAVLLVPSSSGVDDLDGATGTVRTSYSLSAVPPGAVRLDRVGSGFVLGGSQGTAVFR